ncbi:MAG: hypothetical protein NC081_00565 [Roseburia sp.]|nr:hypothetical protein [Roseburia sp.]
MSAFFSDVLDCVLSPVFLKEVGEKFHYEESRLPELSAVAEQMLPLIRSEAFWAGHKSCIWDAGENASVAYEDVVMTLGGQIDCLQERFTQRGQLCECYMLEALASELLLRAYRAYNQYIRENDSWHVARYHFPGSEEGFSLERLPQMLENLTPLVACNEAFCILPKKSVVFVAELTQNEEIQCEGICLGCSSINCANRMTAPSPLEKRQADLLLNYGYSRIFGKNAVTIKTKF